MTVRDPRLTPARSDLAASYLRGEVDAARYSDGVLQEVIDAQAPLRQGPFHGATLLTEAVRGERVMVYETDDEGWAWGQLQNDGYVGFMPTAALLAPSAEATHRVAALRTLLFPGPSIKLPPLQLLSLGALVAITGTQDTFAVGAGGFIPARHLAPLAAMESDFVAVAERFIGAPYLWGGKTSLGLDCSGLVQVALTAAGVSSPRDSDMQEAALGAPVDLSVVRRGDLLFWKGHVGIARDATTLLHANAFHMAVASEPLAPALARIAAAGSPLTSVRRLT